MKRLFLLRVLVFLCFRLFISLAFVGIILLEAASLFVFFKCALSPQTKNTLWHPSIYFHPKEASLKHSAVFVMSLASSPASPPLPRAWCSPHFALLLASPPKPGSRAVTARPANRRQDQRTTVSGVSSPVIRLELDYLVIYHEDQTLGNCLKAAEAASRGSRVVCCIRRRILMEWVCRRREGKALPGSCGRGQPAASVTHVWSRRRSFSWVWVYVG